MHRLPYPIPSKLQSQHIPVFPFAFAHVIPIPIDMSPCQPSSSWLADSVLAVQALMLSQRP